MAAIIGKPGVLLFGRTPLGVNVPILVDATGLLAGGGNPFNQSLNVADSPTFVAVTLSGGALSVGAITGTTSVATPTVKLTPVAFAALPGAPVEGMVASVNNSNTAVWGATIAGGGANKVLAYYNGTNWTVAGK